MGASYSYDVGDIAKARNVVLVLLRKTGTGAEVMLTREGRGGSRHKWALPGGGIKSYQTPVQALKAEAKEEVGLADKMWFNHTKYGVDYVMCGSTAYFFRVLRPQHTRNHKLVYMDGHVGVRFPDSEIDAVHWTPLSVVLDGGDAVKDFLADAQRRSEGLRGCFAWCLKNRDVLGALRDLQGKL